MEAKINAEQLEPIGDISGQEEFKDKSVNKRKRFFDAQVVFCLNFGISHFFAIVGLVLAFQGRVNLSTFIFVEVTTMLAGLGVTVGAHRLYSHRCFKATTPFKILMATLFTFAGQQSLWLWSAWHRIHHKFSDTDRDPHNSRRGFFYSHMGWILTYDHKTFLENLGQIDISDLESDPVVMFHKKYYGPLHMICMFIIPTLIPWYFLGESLIVSFCVGACLRYCWLFHRTMLIGSAAHMWGNNKPYDSSIRPVDNKWIAHLAGGEGWHNYHHVFPWDYKAAELGQYRWNFSTAFIDFFAWIGWAYDLKSVSKEAVMTRKMRTGNHHNHQNGPWGWGDGDIPDENIVVTESLYPTKDY